MIEIIFSASLICLALSLLFHFCRVLYSILKSSRFEYRNLTDGEAALHWSGVQIRSTYSVLWAVLIVFPLGIAVALLATIDALEVLALSLTSAILLFAINLVLSAGTDSIAIRVINYRTIGRVLDFFNSRKAEFVEQSFESKQLFASKQPIGRILLRLSIRVVKFSKNTELL